MCALQHSASIGPDDIGGRQPRLASHAMAFRAVRLIYTQSTQCVDSTVEQHCSGDCSTLATGPRAAQASPAFWFAHSR